MSRREIGREFLRTYLLVLPTEGLVHGVLRGWRRDGGAVGGADTGLIERHVPVYTAVA